MENIDIKLRVMVVGDHTVGKTCLIRRYAENEFSENYIATVGVDFSAKTMEIPVQTESGPNELKMRYMIYDIGSQQQYRNRIETWVPQTMVFVICYDITQPATLDSVPTWKDSIIQIIDKLSEEKGFQIPYTFIIVGTKRDLTPEIDIRWDNFHVTADQLQKVCELTQISYTLETSAKTGENVNELFEMLGKMAFNNLIRLNILDLIQEGISEDQINEIFLQRHGYLPVFNEINF
jgi:Ras-related protein Rab-1A